MLKMQLDAHVTKSSVAGIGIYVNFAMRSLGGEASAEAQSCHGTMRQRGQGSQQNFLTAVALGSCHATPLRLPLSQSDLQSYSCRATTLLAQLLSSAGCKIGQNFE